MADDNYEHWPDDAKLKTRPAAAAPGYDAYNGLREHVYQAPGAAKKKAVEEPKSLPTPQDEKYGNPHPQMMPYPDAYPQMQYPQMQYPQMQFPQMQYPQMQYPQMAYPQMAYVAPPAQPHFRPAAPGAVPVQPPYVLMNYAPAPAAPAEEQTEEKKDEKKEKKAKAPSPRKWQGRTKAEVDEDNMKIAAREGAYAERKVQPIDMEPDQIVWCIELDHSNALRTFAECNELKGQWMADPRFKNSWYFLREEEKKEKKGKKAKK